MSGTASIGSSKAANTPAKAMSTAIAKTRKRFSSDKSISFANIVAPWVGTSAGGHPSLLGHLSDQQFRLQLKGAVVDERRPLGDALQDFNAVAVHHSRGDVD